MQAPAAAGVGPAVAGDHAISSGEGNDWSIPRSRLSTQGTGRIICSRQTQRARARDLAQANVHAVAPHLDGWAALVLPRIPTRPLASSTLHTGSASSGKAPLYDVVTNDPWISLNTAEYENAVTIDCDNTRWLDQLDILHSYGCPLPNFIVCDPYKGTAHVTWMLADPVRTTDDALPKPRWMLGVVRDGLAGMLTGDYAFTNRLTKNPCAVGRALPIGSAPAFPAIWEAYCAARTGLRWHTMMMNLEPVRLGSLYLGVMSWAGEQELPPPRRRFTRHSAVAESSKGQLLFDAARFRIYQLARDDFGRAINADVVREIIEAEADRLGSPASERDRAGMTKRIVRWMRTRWRRQTGRAGHGRNGGTMGLNLSDLPLHKKQSLAAKRSRAAVAALNDLKIGVAFEALRAEGIHVTQAAVAARAGVSLRTVASRWAALKQATGTCNKLPNPLVTLGGTSSTPISGCVAKVLAAGKICDVGRSRKRLWAPWLVWVRNGEARAMNLWTQASGADRQRDSSAAQWATESGRRR